MLASSSTTRMRARPWRTSTARDCAARLSALAIQPCVDVTLAEPPLPAHPHRRDFSCFYEPVDNAEVDLR